MPQTYIVNGSRYQAKICYSDPETDGQTSVVIDIAEVCVVPPAVNSITIILQKGEGRKILENWKVNDGDEGDKSIIITEEGSIQHGHRNEDKADTDWMWKSSSNGKNHRPRKFFIANASGKVIKVQRVDRNGQSSKTSCVYINHGETETLNHDHVKITSLPYLLYRPFTDTEQEIFEGTVEPRTSVVVCDMSAKTTGRLYGEDIEAKKWIVDGRDYKPTSVIDKEKLYTLLYSVKTGACKSGEFVDMVTSKVVAMLGERYKRYIGYGAL